MYIIDSLYDTRRNEVSTYSFSRAYEWTLALAVSVVSVAVFASLPRELSSLFAQFLLFILTLFLFSYAIYGQIKNLAVRLFKEKEGENKDFKPGDAIWWAGGNFGFVAFIVIIFALPSLRTVGLACGTATATLVGMFLLPHLKSLAISADEKRGRGCIRDRRLAYAMGFT